MNWMPGDIYHVHFSNHGQTGTASGGPWDSWQEAKKVRNAIIKEGKVTSVWMMRENPSLGSRLEKFGDTIRVN